MARIRTIKPAAFISDTVDRYAGDMFRTFVGLFCYVDDKGRGRDDVALIRADVWPRVKRVTETTILAHLEAFTVKDGPICRYTVDGKAYIHFVNWREHQKINRPTPSKFPPCPTHEEVGFFDE